MACTPYNPAVGLFINDSTASWNATPSSGSWSFQYNRDQGGFSVYRLSHSGSTMDELFIPSGGAVAWVYFGGYLAVRNAASSAGFVTYRIWIYKLNSSGVTSYELGGGPYSASGGTPQLHFQYSSDGEAFFIFIGGDSGPNSTHTHKVFRTGTGDGLCSWGPISNVMAARHAEITAARTVRIKTLPGTPPDGDIYASCPLPSGECEITPSSQTFSDVYVGGCAFTPQTKQFTIKNSGDDCLTVSAISNSTPFSVQSTTPTLPATLAKNETVAVTVVFNPSSAGNWNSSSLAVTTSPANGDNELICKGKALTAEFKIQFSSTSFSFGKHPVGTPSPGKTLTITNNGSKPLPVSVPVLNVSGFTCAGFNGTLDCGDSQTIALGFTPQSEGTASASLSITSSASGSPHSISLSGEGCIANAEINPPSTAPISFGTIQRGFRTVRFIKIQNAGDGELTFRASISGADASLFGLQPPSGSVIDVMGIRQYSVAPVSGCGAVTTGSGDVIVAVAFYANDAPRSVSVDLVIDSHNATNTTTASWTIPLQAQIIAVEAVDAILVLDRSGSMDQSLGSRKKIDAALAGGQLFAELSRENVEDRLGIVRYNQTPEIVQSITDITTASKPTIVSQISSSNFTPDGTTAIAGGMIVGMNDINTPRATIPPVLHKALVVLTDGKDNTGYLNPADNQWYSLLGGEVWHPNGGNVMTVPINIPSDIKVYGIGLGTNEDVDSGRLDVISSATGAPFRVTGDLSGEAYFTLEKYFTEIYMEVASNVLIMDPVWTINPGQEHRVDFYMLKGDVSALVVIFDQNGIRLPFHLETPTGEIIDVTSVPPGFQLRSGLSATARFVELRVPQGDPLRYAGRWQVVVNHPGKVCYGGAAGYATHAAITHVPDYNATIGFGFVVGDKCVDYNEPVSYGLAIGAGSNFRMQPFVTPGIVHTGEPILLSAMVSEAGLPVAGCTVTVKSVSPSGVVRTFMLYDDGIHDDGDEDDGEYAVVFGHTSEAGGYQFTFRAEGISRDNEPVVREAALSKYIEGRISIGPDPGKPATFGDRCCRRIVLLLTLEALLLIIILIVLLRRL
ncbi:MAG: choice-of-anchor D domain-containing protein [Nitrospirae bacterium]|nr:choice-of-anchor D domain-containing protein [Nitrospirota bacterium]